MSGMPVTVVAAMIWQQQRILICQRREIDPFPGKWEFPGGKVESGEEPRAALGRELFEELGIRARIGEEVAQVEHQYPGNSLVHLLFFTVQDFDGVPENRVFQQILWVSPQELSGFDFLEADRPLIERIAGREFSPPAPRRGDRSRTAREGSAAEGSLNATMQIEGEQENQGETE